MKHINMLITFLLSVSKWLELWRFGVEYLIQMWFGKQTSVHDALVVIIIHIIFVMGTRRFTLCHLYPCTTQSAAVTINISTLADVKRETRHAAVTSVSMHTGGYLYFLEVDFNLICEFGTNLNATHKALVVRQMDLAIHQRVCFFLMFGLLHFQAKSCSSV